MGTPTTFETIFRAHLTYVVRVSKFFGAPDRETEDVAQNVFSALHRAIKENRFDAESHPGPWLRAAAYRITRDHRIALAHQGSPTKYIEGSSIEPMDENMESDPERTINYKEQLQMVLSLLDELEYEHRTVFVLHELEQQTQEQIALDLGVPVTTVRSRLRTALEGFNQALQRRRAIDRRKFRAPCALLLPLGADSLLQLVRGLPSPEVPAGAEARIWDHLQQQGNAPAPALAPPRLPRKLMPSARKILSTAGVFLSGVGAGVALAALVASRSAPEQPPVPIVAVASLEDGYIPAVFSPAIFDTASASATPAVSSTGAPALTSEEEAERRCLQAAGMPLDAKAPDPAQALLLLARCDERFPPSRFPVEHARIRREGRAGILRSSGNR